MGMFATATVLDTVVVCVDGIGRKGQRCSFQTFSLVAECALQVAFLGCVREREREFIQFGNRNQRLGAPKRRFLAFCEPVRSGPEGIFIKGKRN